MRPTMANRVEDQWPDTGMPTLYNDVVIIGAGFSGINLACQLQRKLNFTDYVIYDRGYNLGGTWSSNKCKNPIDYTVNY